MLRQACLRLCEPVTLASLFPSPTVAVTGLKLKFGCAGKHTGRFPAAGIGGGVYLLGENPVEAMQSSVGYHALPA